jgi:hypothetical protein
LLSPAGRRWAAAILAGAAGCLCGAAQAMIDASPRAQLEADATTTAWRIISTDAKRVLFGAEAEEDAVGVPVDVPVGVLDAARERADARVPRGEVVLAERDVAERTPGR